MLHRHANPFIRHVLKTFQQRTLTAAEAADQLSLSRSQLYLLATDYLRACVQKKGHLWTPGRSGGNHTTPWPPAVIDLLVKRLACSPPCPYSFVASEAFRLHGFKLDRAQMRHWALQNGHAHATPTKKPQAPVRRWQRSQIGEIWQLDASPHRWFPQSAIDTQLGSALKFYDISLLYAPTPEAKGKIEREHQFWQRRLPPYFASEKVTELQDANTHIDALRLHHNAHETHRELQQTPQRAWELAKKEKRSVLRSAPKCPWWPYVWSLRTSLKIGSDGRVPIGSQRVRLEYPQGSKVILCLHPSGHSSVLAHQPDKNLKPIILFTNR